jgi:hypothetical protein
LIELPENVTQRRKTADRFVGEMHFWGNRVKNAAPFSYPGFSAVLLSIIWG